MTSTLPPLATLWVLLALGIVLVGGLGFPWWLVAPLYAGIVVAAFGRDRR